MRRARPGRRGIPSKPDRRSFIAGLGSSGALIAAVIIAFVAVGGVVAINGLPESSEPASAGSVVVESARAGVEDPEVEDGGGGRVEQGTTGRAENRRGGDGRAPADGGRDSGSGPAAGSPEPIVPSPGPVPPGLTPPAQPPVGPPPVDPDPTPPEPNPPPPANPPSPGPVPQPESPGSLGGLVDSVAEVIEGVGFHPGPAGAIRPVTDPVDGVIDGLGVPPNAVPQLPDLVSPRSGR